jgi:iron complex outermembrane receptor protein
LARFGISAQEKPRDSVPEQIEQIIISRYHINDSLMNAPASVGIVSETDLQRGNYTDIVPAINMVSGVFMQSGAFNTNRISIRGIGARTPFGTNKIRAFYGSIPLTSGDSETTIEDINTENIGQIEIIKGPLSSLYGAGLGGAILISPQIFQGFGSKASVSATFGSFGTIKNNYNYAYNSERSNININFHKLESDGWRQNSAYLREGVTIAGELLRSEKGQLTYLANYTYMKAFIPSSISREMFEENPQAAAPTWLASQGYEQYKSYLGGIGYDVDFGTIRNSTSIFVNVRDSNEPRPFDILKQNNVGYGVRTQFSAATGFFGKMANFILGGEYFRDGFKGRIFENLYQDNNGNGSLQGEKLTVTEQDRKFFNAFLQMRIPIINKLELQAGVNMNRTEFRLDNVFPTEAASSAKYAYDVIWSPQVSLLYKPDKLSTIHFSASRGFSLPSVEETLTATGTINTSIKPENGYNVEMGGKFYLLNKHLFTDFSLYRMKINDLLVARRIGDDQYVGVNAGETLHQGMEAALRYSGNISKKLTLEAFVSASFGKYEFLDFVDAENDFSGNELTGVPDTKVGGGIILGISGAYFSADMMYVDDIPMNDANTEFSDSYSVLNLKAGYRLQASEKLLLHFAAGVNNVADEHYASMVLVNATAPPNAAPRYFYPGLPANYYGQFSFSYSF